MNRLNFENIIQRVLELYPEYKDSEHYKTNDFELQFPFFAGFTSYVVEKILKSEDPGKDKEIKSYFELFNQMIESKDEKLSNLGVVEVVETLVQAKKSKEVAKKLLNEKGKIYMAEVLKYTGVSE